MYHNLEININWFKNKIYMHWRYSYKLYKDELGFMANVFWFLINGSYISAPVNLHVFVWFFLVSSRHNYFRTLCKLHSPQHLMFHAHFGSVSYFASVCHILRHSYECFVSCVFLQHLVRFLSRGIFTFIFPVLYVSAFLSFFCFLGIYFFFTCELKSS